MTWESTAEEVSLLEKDRVSSSVFLPSTLTLRPCLWSEERLVFAPGLVCMTVPGGFAEDSDSGLQLCSFRNRLGGLDSCPSCSENADLLLCLKEFWKPGFAQ